MREVYIAAARRTPVGKAPRGSFRRTRPDDLLAAILRATLAEVPSLDWSAIDDVIVGCAMPEAEQGMNVARIGALLAGLPDSVPGVTVNRFCASGLQTVAQAADRIGAGAADVVVAGGTESMTMIPFMGQRPAFNPRVLADDANVAIAYGMGLTAERVAERWGVERGDQDAFALESHRRAVAAQDAGLFEREIAPVETVHREPGADSAGVAANGMTVTRDDGPRRDTDVDKLAKLKPAFAAGGSVTAGNSSQMSDGAGAAVVASGDAVERYGLEPIARFHSYAVAGVAPEVMGIGPVAAIPKALAQAGLERDDLGWIELNEAFAAQSLAVMRELGLDPERVNPLGGAIALGHPLGATGAIRTATLLEGLRRTGQRYGMVTMCVGTGMGAAGVFEALKDH
jgi:acetyl-CoA acyltransferase